VARRVADDSAALTFWYEHEFERRVYQLYHCFDQVSDFPLGSGTESLVCDENEFSQVTRHEQGGLTGVRKDISSIFVWYTQLLICFVSFGNSFDKVHEGDFVHGLRYYYTKAVFGAVTLATLSEAAVSVSYELMGTRSGDAFNFEGEINVFEDTVMSVFVEVLHQAQRVFRIAVVTDACDFRDKLNRVWGGLT
jgi:hypothetical protein